jgi:hypothetical protein
MSRNAGRFCFKISENRRRVARRINRRWKTTRAFQSQGLARIIAEDPAHHHGRQRVEMAPVGGIPRSVVADRLPSVVAIVVLGTFAALLLGFRSVFVAVKVMALNLLSVGAAIGALGDGYP